MNYKLWINIQKIIILSIIIGVILFFVKSIFPRKEYKPYYTIEYPDIVNQQLRKQWEIYEKSKPDDLFVFHQGQYDLTDTGKKFIKELYDEENF